MCTSTCPCTVSQDDADGLNRQGVAAVFGPAATTSEIVDFLREVALSLLAIS